MNPQTQLAAFAESRDERTFRRLMKAYGGLVYGIALRKTGSPQMAEEITQNVFLIVARKARPLSKRQGFVAWLHRTTAYEAANFLRTETHRKQTMKRYALELETETAEQRWLAESLRQAVDDAIASLSSCDRLALLYRFFEGRDFRDIGVLLGKSEAAAQKQTRRALEKLASLLRKRGVVTSLTVLTSLLSSELSKAAPAGLVTGIAKQASIEAASGSLTSTLALAMTTHKTFVVAGIILLAGLVPLTKKQARIGDLSDRRDHLLAASPMRKVAAVRTRHRPTSQKTTKTGRSGEVKATTLVRAFLKDMGRLGAMRLTGTGLKEVGRELAYLTDDELWHLYLQINSESAGGDVKQEVREWLVLGHLAGRGPAAALEAALQDRMREEVFVQVMRRWASEESNAAADWFNERRQNERLGVQRLDGASPESALLRGLVEGIANTNLDEAVTFVRNHESSEDAPTMISGLSRALLSAGDHESYLELASSLSEPSARLLAYANHATTILSQPANPEETIHNMNTFLHHVDFPAEQRGPVLEETANRLALAIHRGSISRRGVLPWMMLRSTNAENLSMLAQTGEPLDATRERLADLLRNTFQEPATDDPAALDGANFSGKR